MGTEKAEEFRSGGGGGGGGGHGGLTKEESKPK